MSATQGVNGGDADSSKSKDAFNWELVVKPAAAVAALAAVLTGLGFSGVLERMPRNHPVCTSVAFALVAVAGLVWVWSIVLRPDQASATPAGDQPPAGTPPPGESPPPVGTPPAAGTPPPQKPWWRRPEKILVGTAAVLFTAGVALAIGVVVGTYGETEKPELSAAWEGETLTLTVKAGGLQSDESIGIRIDGLNVVTDQAGRLVWGGNQLLYKSGTGPSSAGKVEQTIKIPVAAEDYGLIRVQAATSDAAGRFPAECPTPAIAQQSSETTDPDAAPTAAEDSYDFRPGPGCLFMRTPPAPSLPVVSASWTVLADGSRAITIHVVTHDLDREAVVQVVAGRLRGGKIPRLLGKALMEPNGTDGIDAELVVPVADRVKRICAIVGWYDTKYGGSRIPIPQCPPELNTGMSWVMLQAPAVVSPN